MQRHLYITPNPTHISLIRPQRNPPPPPPPSTPRCTPPDSSHTIVHTIVHTTIQPLLLPMTSAYPRLAALISRRFPPFSTGCSVAPPPPSLSLPRARAHVAAAAGGCSARHFTAGVRGRFDDGAKGTYERACGGGRRLMFSSSCVVSAVSCVGGAGGERVRTSLLAHQAQPTGSYSQHPLPLSSPPSLPPRNLL